MLPQPPELFRVLRRASFTLGTFAYSSSSTCIMDCRNGGVLVGWFVRGVHNPLRPERGIVVVPPFPDDTLEDETCYNFGQLLSKEGSNGVAVYFFMPAHVYMLQDGGWHIHTSATIQLPKMPQDSYIVLAHDKIYMPATLRRLLVLDMASSSFSTIEFPDGLVHKDGHTMLSPADDSGVYLIHVKRLKLNVWLHRGDNGRVNIWLLVDTICLREMCANVTMSNQIAEGEHAIAVNINEVGDNAEFVFLQMGESVFYLDLKSKQLHKVYERTGKDRCLVQIHPFLMIWPPIFPVPQE